MGLPWAGLALLGLSWVYLTPLVGRPDPRAGAFIAGLGLLLALLGMTLTRRPTRVGELLGVVHAVVASWALAAAVGLTAAPLQRSLFARVHRIPWLAEPLARFLGLFGLPAAADPGRAEITVTNGRFANAFAVSAELLGLWIALGVIISVGVGLWLARARVRVWLQVGAVVAGYLLLRYLVLVYWYSNLLDPSHHAQGIAPFARQGLLVATFAPLAVVLAALLARHRELDERLGRLRLMARPPLVATAVLAAGLFALALASLLVDPGRPKQGRILIDDFHSGTWEPTLEVIDTETYGSMSVYNLRTLYDFLSLHYPQVDVFTEGPLTERRLADYDVLILKTPTRPLAPAEIRAVEAFVRDGGGVWLVGDHTNLLGMGTYTNAVAERFGFRFRYDACNALSTGYFGEWRRPALALHPVVQRVPKFQLLTSASLEAGWSTDMVMAVTDLLSDPIDYSKPSFFGDISPDPGDDFGVLPLAIAVREGRGRVVAFADSTVLSSFAILKEGHIEFAMATIDYLNRRNLLGRWLNGLLLAAGLALAVLALRLLARVPRAAVVPSALLALLAGVGGGALVARQSHELFYPPVPAHSPYASVGFLTEGSSFHLAPAISRILVPAGSEYSTFFVAMQRLGLFPRQLPTLDDIDGDAALVIMNPSTAPSERLLQKAVDYVRGGGRLLVMLPDRPPNRAAESWLASFEIGLKRQQRMPDPPADPGTFGAGLLLPAAAPRESRLSGTRLLPIDPELPIEAHFKPFGAGRLVVVFGSSYFSRAGMGHVMEEPDEDRKRRYRLQYLLVHDLLGLGTAAEPRPDASTASSGR